MTGTKKAFQKVDFLIRKEKQKLTSKGWNIGASEDGGMFYYYYKDLIDFNLTVVLNFMGDTLGYDEG